MAMGAVFPKEQAYRPTQAAATHMEHICGLEIFKEYLAPRKTSIICTLGLSPHFALPSLPSNVRGITQAPPPTRWR